MVYAFPRHAGLAMRCGRDARVFETFEDSSSEERNMKKGTGFVSGPALVVLVLLVAALPGFSGNARTSGHPPRVPLWRLRSTWVPIPARRVTKISTERTSKRLRTLRQVRNVARGDAVCMKCQADKQGPFWFEHLPVSRAQSELRIYRDFESARKVRFRLRLQLQRLPAKRFGLLQRQSAHGCDSARGQRCRILRRE